MHKLLTWAKSHKIAAGAIGCGGLIVLGFVLLIIAGLILTAVGYEPAETEEPEAVATTQAPEVTPEAEAIATTPPATEEATSEPPKPAETEAVGEPEDADEPEGESLAKRVEEAAYRAAMIDNFQEMSSDSPVWAVSKIEDVSSGTIRVYVQEDQTDEQAELTARWFMNMTCSDIEELKTVVVRDTSGVDRNHFMFMMDPPTICS